MKKYLIVGDSLAMVRPRDNVLFLDLYATKLARERPESLVVNGGVRANSSKGILSESYFDEYVSALPPDHVVVHLGIVDCTPRIFHPLERLVLDLMGRTKIGRRVSEKVISFRSQRRFSYTQKKSISLVPLSQFQANLRLFFASVRSANPAVQFTFVNIAYPGAKMIERNFGMLDQIRRYNDVLEAEARAMDSKVVDLFSFSRLNPHVVLDDGYHINSEAHMYLYSELRKIL
jgi:lysophospholipase L1-like esterase